MTQISEATITDALLSCKGCAQGARPVLVIGSPLHLEMKRRGLVTLAGNLTRAGSIACQRAKSADLNAAIPL